MALRRRSTRVRTIDPTGVNAELSGTLETLDGADRYAAWISDLVQEHVGPRTLELGAGHGTFTGRLARRADHLVATDISEEFVGVLGRRYRADSRIEVVHGGWDSAALHGPYDTIVLINVLEHIEDDDRAIRELFAMLNPGGRLVLWVPAFELLYSRFDRQVGHYRRYRAKGLRAQLEHAGYEQMEVRYFNMPGAVAWLLMTRLLGLTPTTGVPVKLFDRLVVPVTRFLEARYRAPFGQSIFAVASRPLDPTPQTQPESARSQLIV